MRTKIEQIKTYDPIWKDYAFDRVEVSSKHGNFSFLGILYSEYKSGPNLCQLADAAGELQGFGYYGLASCRPLGRVCDQKEAL